MVKGYRKFNKFCGIYCIENMVNHKKYIGQSKHIFIRWRNHRKLLHDNRHINKHLQKSFNKYGSEKFVYSILEICNENDLNEKEMLWISNFNTGNSKYGYNLTEGGQGSKLGDEGRARRKAMAAHGESANSKISEKQVKSIIDMMVNGISNKEIEDKTGVKYYIISSIRGKRSWKYLTENINFPKSKMSPRSLSLLASNSDEEKIMKVIEMLNDGYTNSYIASHLNIISGMVSSIRCHRQYKDFTDGLVFPRPTKGSNIHKGKKYNYTDIKNAVDIILSGKSILDTSRITGISVPLLKKIRNKEMWTNVTNGIEFTKYKLPSSGYYGVIKVGDKWEAKIQHHGKITMLGRFISPVEAAKVYDVAAAREFGDKYAKINFKEAV